MGFATNLIVHSQLDLYLIPQMLDLEENQYFSQVGCFNRHFQFQMEFLKVN